MHSIIIHSNLLTISPFSIIAFRDTVFSLCRMSVRYLLFLSPSEFIGWNSPLLFAFQYPVQCVQINPAAVLIYNISVSKYSHRKQARVCSCSDLQVGV